MRYIKKGELQDDSIVAALHAAARDYENGEIIEVKDRLLEIVAAIEEFESQEDSEAWNTRALS